MDQDPVAQRFGAKLRTVRLARELTQAELPRAGVQPVHVSRLERGVREPRLTTIRALFAGLDAEADELLAGFD